VAKHRSRNEPRPVEPRQHAAAGDGKARSLAVKEIAPSEPAWIAYALRLWLAAMFGWTLWVTRAVWSVHSEPPMLPAFEWSWLPLERFDYYGEALFTAFASAIIWPRLGWTAYVVVAAAAMFADQTRMQPQMFSFALLLLGTWESPRAKLIARTHLASLWFFSGVHKLLSPGYYATVAPWLWQGIAPVADYPTLADYAGMFGATLAGIETAMGIAVWIPRLRRYVAGAAFAMHFGIVALLNHLDGWNTSVWGWNCAIAIVGFALIVRWRGPLLDDFRRCGRATTVAAVLLFVSPLLFYVGRLDAYLCHCLYSDNVASATFYSADRRRVFAMNGQEGPYWSNVNVPLPPAHRIFETYFRRVAEPGDVLIVRDPRWWAKKTLNSDYQWRCDANGCYREQLAPREGK